MRRTGKSIFISLFITLTAFFSVAYTACKKTEVTPSEDLCASITCQNGGTCFKGKCSCPGGYEGDFCETKAIDKFLGTWLATERVTGSSLPSNIGTEKKYTVNMEPKQGSGVDFFINDFMGNQDYDGVACRMGMNAKQETVAYNYFGFFVNTIATSTVLIISGEGSVNNFGTYINATYIRTYPSAGGAVTDTLSIAFER